MTHFIIFALVIYVLFRAAIRRRPDPMVGRLVPRDPELHADICAWHKHQHDTFAERHTVNFYPAPAPKPEPYDMLAAYRPKDI